jgi:hypothetical protein
MAQKLWTVSATGAAFAYALAAVMMYLRVRFRANQCALRKPSGPSFGSSEKPTADVPALLELE